MVCRAAGGRTAHVRRAGDRRTSQAKASGSGTLTIGSVIYDQLLLNNLRSSVALDHGVVRLAPQTADVYGGKETGSITIDTRPMPMTYAVNTKVSRVDAINLISSASSVKQTLYGPATQQRGSRHFEPGVREPAKTEAATTTATGSAASVSAALSGGQRIGCGVDHLGESG